MLLLTAMPRRSQQRKIQIARHSVCTHAKDPQIPFIIRQTNTRYSAGIIPKIHVLSRIHVLYLAIEIILGP